MTWAKPDEHRPIVCGHRGVPGAEPENTLASFREARVRGATWIEFDVRPTGDGVLAIHHDSSTADGVHLGSSSYRDLDASIPCFADLAAALPEMGLDIEMKTDGIEMPVEAFADLVVSEIDAHCRSLDSVIVTSFDATALSAVRERRPDLATGLLFWERTIDEALAIAADAGHVALAPWIELLTQEMVDQIRSASLDILTWTVNSADQVMFASSAGVDMIIGDDPTLIIENL